MAAKRKPYQTYPEAFKLEALRLLTNLETEKFKLLQVVVLGQPELDRRLARVSASAVLEGLRDKGFYLQMPPGPEELRRRDDRL